MLILLCLPFRLQCTLYFGYRPPIVSHNDQRRCLVALDLLISHLAEVVVCVMLLQVTGHVFVVLAIRGHRVGCLLLHRVVLQSQPSFFEGLCLV